MEEIIIENLSGTKQLIIEESVLEKFAKMLVDKFEKEQINEKEVMYES